LELHGEIPSHGWKLSAARRKVPPARGSLELHEEIPSHGSKSQPPEEGSFRERKLPATEGRPLPARGRLKTLEDGSSRGRKLRTA